MGLVVIEISIRSQTSLLERAVLRMSSELRDEATKRVVGRSGALVRRGFVDAMPKRFDRPTPWTVNSVRYAASSDQAVLFLAYDTSKGVSAEKYLAAEVRGGARRNKRSEQALEQRGLLPAGMQVAPGRGDELDRFGNLRGGLVVQALAGVGAMRETGFAANATAKSRQRWQRKGLAHRRTGTPFFVGRSPESGTAGIYQIMGRHRVRAVMHFIAKPIYRERLPFDALAREFAAQIVPAQVRRVFHEIADGTLRV